MVAGGAARARRARAAVRALLPPPRFTAPDAEASVTHFLSSSALAKTEAPEVSDPAFRAHIALLRRVTLHPFDVYRYLFVYKPLARVHAALSTQLLAVGDVDARTATMSPLLRSAAMYVAANAHRSVYAMVLSCELKSAFRGRPAAENIMPDVVLAGEMLSDQEVAALDFVQELSSELSYVCEDTKRRVIDGATESDGQLERVIAGVAAHAAFVARLASVVDFELSYETVQFATSNLQGLPWKPSGGHFLIESLENDVDDPFSLDSVSGSARQRLNKGRRSARVHRDRSSHKERRSSYVNVRRVSHFLAHSITAPRMAADVSRSAETWMRAALLPPAGQIFEMNDLITRLWGFEPFFLSTTVMTCEQMRRSFVLAAKELLFQEKEVSKRCKFIVCYVLARGAEAARTAAHNGAPLGEREGSRVTHVLARARSRSLASSTLSSATPPPPPPYAGDYDALAIMSAHAAFLACRHGATPTELRLAADLSRVRALCDSHAEPDDAPQSATASSEDTPEEDDGATLSRQDAAAALLAHAMAGRPARVDAALLRTFEAAYGSPLKRSARGGRICHRALLEVVGAACVWSALERFACAALAFDIDMTSTLMFGTGRAEPVIMDFAQSDVGKDVRLSLVTDEVADARARRDSKVGRMSSLLGGFGSGPPRSPYNRKRSSSALATAPSRVIRMLSAIGPTSTG